MIAYIKGTLAYIQENAIIVDVAGIGYEIICPNPYVFEKSMEEELFVHTYHHVREDVQSLYGFKDEEEKYLFTKLISVSGIGPKSAVAILGRVHVPDFIAAVETEDEKYLTQFPGVGKKTARQIILDLKGKLTSMVTLENVDALTKEVPTNATALNDAKGALKSLGYTDRELNHILPQLEAEDLEKTDAIIRKALLLLTKN